MSTDNLKIDSKTMDRFRIILTKIYGKYHGLLTPMGTQAIAEFCEKLEDEAKAKAEAEDVEPGSVPSRGKKAREKAEDLEKVTEALTVEASRG